MIIKVDSPPAISVIVPIYNVQDYLAEALNSIINQDFSHPFEILLVEDCSIDNSRQVCEEFIAKFPGRATLICHPENKGSSVARNSGLAAITGEYFMFVDPDDVLPTTALQTLYDAAITYQADIVKGNNLIFDETGSRPANYNVSQIETYENDDILSVFLAHQKTRGHPWGKLFRRAAFAHITYTPGVAMAQDALYCAEIFASAKKMVLINKDIYHYRLRKTGATGRKFQTGAYLWWLYSIENCGRFATTPAHKTHHKELQIHTLLQLSREARKLDNKLLAEVLQEITLRQTSWQITSAMQLLKAKTSLHSLLKFFKFKMTLHHLQKQFNQHKNINKTIGAR